MANFREPVAVIGLGRFGIAVALELTRGGTEVLAIDNRPDIAQRLSGQLGQIMVADTTDLDALVEVGVADFGKVVVAIGSDMQASILTTSLLSELEIPDIWAKALSQEHARILKRVGAHHVAMPENDMGMRIAHLVSDQMLDYVEIDQDWVLVKTRPPKELCGVRLDEARLRKRGIAVVSVKPEGASAFRHLDSETYLSYGDEVVIAGTNSDVDKFVKRV